MKKIEIFKVEGDKVVRQRRHCPKCGDGVFLAEHKNRFSCGACSYTEFKAGSNKPPENKVEQKPSEEPKQEEKSEEPKVSQPAEETNKEKSSE